VPPDARGSTTHEVSRGEKCIQHARIVAEARHFAELLIEHQCVLPFQVLWTLDTNDRKVFCDSGTNVGNVRKLFHLARVLCFHGLMPFSESQGDGSILKFFQEQAPQEDREFLFQEKALDPRLAQRVELLLLVGKYHT
jgi:hypothetical protein